MNTLNIFLFGHRKGHGKGTCVEIAGRFCAKRFIQHSTRSFADMLKSHCADRYNLDVSKMGDPEYKMTKPDHLAGLTVRDVLLKEGALGREVWEYVWANSLCNGAYEDFDQGTRVVLVDDLRFPNELSFVRGSDLLCANIVPILVHRVDGRFDDDGADAELPDESGHPDIWKYVIYNDDKSKFWKENLKTQTINIISKELEG